MICPPCIAAAPPLASTRVALGLAGAGVAGQSRRLLVVLRLQSTQKGTAGAASVGYGGRCHCPARCSPSQGAGACRVEHRQQRMMPQMQHRQWRSERPCVSLHMFRYMVIVYSYMVSVYSYMVSVYSYMAIFYRYVCMQRLDRFFIFTSSAHT